MLNYRIRISLKHDNNDNDKNSLSALIYISITIRE